MGYDVLHYWFESAFHKRGLDVDDASRDAYGTARPTFRSLGISGDMDATLLSLFLLERSLRLEEGRAAGIPVDERLSRGLIALLQREETG
jgi:hypothetical protein